mmetsp:Transcript_34547/g.78932  ORF Transcript_34547/g.78932 Transcript_34547/m.78932 type:complete len:282 (+) Transcript_34547:90-935(+)
MTLPSAAVARAAASRKILRECRLLGQKWVPRAPADSGLWGKGFYVDASKPSQALMSQVPTSLAPALRPPNSPLSWVRSRLRANFSSGPQDHIDEAAALLEDVDPVTQFLHSQCSLSSCKSISEVNGLRVEAVSGLATNTLSEKEKGYVFAYNIRFTNLGSHRLRILSRQYDFRDAFGRLRSIVRPEAPEAAGVVGFTPLLPPGSSFEFGSGVILPTAQGCLTGGFSIIHEPEVVAENEELHNEIEKADLMIRYVYYQGLSEVMHVPLGQLRFDADVPCLRR